MRRSVDEAAHRLMKAAAEAMCDEERMIAQLNCSLVAVRPNRRHFKRTGREFLSIVWRQSVTAAEFFHRLDPTMRRIDPCFGSNVIDSQMPAREQAILLLTKCDAPGVISSYAASAIPITFEHTLTEYIESPLTCRRTASRAFARIRSRAAFLKSSDMDCLATRQVRPSDGVSCRLRLRPGTAWGASAVRGEPSISWPRRTTPH